MSEAYVARRRSVAARKLGEEVVVMSAPDSMLFTLNETAGIIWQAADGKTPLSSIVRSSICPEFEVAPEQAMIDAEELVRELVLRGIMEISDQPIVNATGN